VPRSTLLPAADSRDFCRLKDLQDMTFGHTEVYRKRQLFGRRQPNVAPPCPERPFWFNSPNKEAPRCGNTWGGDEPETERRAATAPGRPGAQSARGSGADR
jgi:hypothetical protein